MNINSDSKAVAKMATVLKRFKIPLYLGTCATVVGNRLSNFAGNVSRGMLKSNWNVMRRMIEGFNRTYILQKEFNLLNRKWFIRNTLRNRNLKTKSLFSKIIM